MRLLALTGLLLLTLAGLGASTQYIVANLHYAPQLGPPWLVLGDLRLYPPWDWIIWDRLYGARAPLLFRNAGGLTTLASVFGCAVALAAALRRKSSGPSRAHGSSRWATTAEIRAAGLLRDAGVVLCQTNDAEFRTTVDSRGKARTAPTRFGALVRHDGPEHVFCFAPTRSGKGVGLVIPTLLTWPHSVLVYDIKRENWALTAGWRKQFSRVWL
jgi:type IV secretion system protein VirD4